MCTHRVLQHPRSVGVVVADDDDGVVKCIAVVTWPAEDARRVGLEKFQHVVRHLDTTQDGAAAAQRVLDVGKAHQRIGGAPLQQACARRTAADRTARRLQQGAPCRTLLRQIVACHAAGIEEVKVGACLHRLQHAVKRPARATSALMQRVAEVCTRPQAHAPTEWQPAGARQQRNVCSWNSQPRS